MLQWLVLDEHDQEPALLVEWRHTPDGWRALGLVLDAEARRWCRERSGRSAAQLTLSLTQGQVTRPGHRRRVNHFLAFEADLACRIGWGAVREARSAQPPDA